MLDLLAMYSEFTGEHCSEGQRPQHLSWTFCIASYSGK